MGFFSLVRFTTLDSITCDFHIRVFFFTTTRFFQIITMVFDTNGTLPRRRRVVLTMAVLFQLATATKIHDPFERMVNFLGKLTHSGVCTAPGFRPKKRKTYSLEDSVLPNEILATILQFAFYSDEIEKRRYDCCSACDLEGTVHSWNPLINILQRPCPKCRGKGWVHESEGD